MAGWKDIPGKIDRLQNGFGGGINTGLPTLQIAVNQASAMSNLVPKQGGAATVRGGRATFGATLGAAVTLLGAHGTTHLLAGAAGTLYYWNGSAWTSIASGFASGVAWDYDTAFNYTWLVNGSQQRKWDGATLSAVGGTPPSTAKFVKEHANHLWMAAGKRASHSALRTPEDFTTAQDSGYFDIENDRGEDISALYSFGSQLLIFADHSFTTVIGTAQENFAPVPASNHVGCIAWRTLQEIRGRLYWLGHDGVYRYVGGTAPQKITHAVRGAGRYDPVQSQISSLNQAQQTKANAAVLGDWYILAIPTGANTEADTVLIYDTIGDTWWVGNLGNVNARQFVSFNDVLYVGDSAGQVWTPYSGTLDNATAISWSWTTGAFTEAGFSQQDIQQVFLAAELPTGSTLSLSVSASPEGETDWTTIASMTAASGYQKKRFTFAPGAAANRTWARLRISGTGPATLHDMLREVLVSPRT